MPTIYRKTAKGVAEIETRAHRLPPRSRGVLIMVDGKRDAAALAAMAPQAEETLASLLAEGFVEAMAEAPPAPQPRPAARPPTAAPPTLPGAPRPGFDQRRRLFVRALNDTLGPAAETLAIKAERCRSDDELQAMLPQAVQVVANMRGRSTAETFQTNCRKALGLEGDA
jgi:hypothetical protein